MLVFGLLMILVQQLYMYMVTEMDCILLYLMILAICSSCRGIENKIATARQTDRQTDRWTDRKRQMDRQKKTDGQTEKRQTGRQTDRWTDRNTD